MEERNNIEYRRIFSEDFNDVKNDLDENPDVLKWAYWAINRDLIGIEIVWKI